MLASVSLREKTGLGTGARGDMGAPAGAHPHVRDPRVKDGARQVLREQTGETEAADSGI